MCWINIEERIRLDEAATVKWMGLREAKNDTANYLRRAGQLVGGLEGAWLDSEEAMWIKEEMELPPRPCLPLYFMRVGSSHKHPGLCYIGKTTNSSRFSGGHRASLKLHQPKYRRFGKYLFRASIWFYYKDEFLPLEWLQPISKAEEILASIEARLIYHYQPIMNTKNKRKDHSRLKFGIQIENHLADSFLHGEML